MLCYKNERINNALLFFAQKHYQKTKKYLSQTALYKYLAFFEFRYLKKTGDMPLGLQYKAMPHGPVPMEIYKNRKNPVCFTLVDFVQSGISGNKGYIVKPKGRFNPDYFAEAEIEEMNALIEMFAQRWVGASTMSDASHRDIKAWKKIYARTPNSMIDPIEEFDRDIKSVPEAELSPQEERYLINRGLSEMSV